MNHLQAFFCVASLLAATSAASSAHAQAEASHDLLQLYQQAQQADPRILAAEQRSHGGRFRQREAYGQLLPQLNASGSFNRNLQEVETGGAGSDSRAFYNGERYALTLSQPLFDPTAWHNYRRFRALANQQQAEYEATREAATVDLIERYFVALAAEDQQALTEAELRATRRNQERVESLYKRQMAMITDVLEVSARVDALEAGTIEARNQVEVSREALAELVGQPLVGRLKRISEQAAFHLPAEGREHWVSQALADNPVLIARQQAVDAAQAAVSQARAGHLPSVSLNLSAQRSDIGYENSQSPRTDTYVASVGVQVPLFSGGSTRARTASSHTDLLSAEQDLEAARRQVLRETRAAFHSMEASLGRIAASRKARTSAEQSRIAAEKAFAFGIMNAVDVLDRVKEEYASQRDLLKAQYDFILNLMMLRRWSGALVEEDVRQVNSWLVAPTPSLR